MISFSNYLYDDLQINQPSNHQFVIFSAKLFYALGAVLDPVLQVVGANLVCQQSTQKATKCFKKLNLAKS